MRLWGWAAVACAAAGTLRAAPLTYDTVQSGVSVVFSTSNPQQTSVALDEFNAVHVAFTDAATQRLRYALLENGSSTWTVADVLSDKVAPQCSLALGTNANARIAYYNLDQGRLEHAQRNGSGWTVSTVETFTGTQTYVSLAVGSDNRSRVAYHQSASSATMYAVQNSGGWDAPVPVSTSPYEGAVALALTSTDSARLAFMSGNDTLGERTLRLGFQGSPSFTVLEYYGFAKTTEPVGGVSLAVDSQNRFHTTFYNTGQAGLHYALFTSTGGFLEEEAVLFSTGTGAGWMSDVAVDRQDEPTLVYLSTGAGLISASLAGSTWTAAGVEAGVLAGVGPSVVTSRLDRIFASYGNGGTGEIRFLTDAARNLSLSGTVTDFSGAPVTDATLSLTGSVRPTALAVDGAGAYSVGTLFEGGYALTPSKAGWAFNPPFRSYDGLASSQSGQDFQGGPVSVEVYDNLFDPTRGEQATVTYSVIPGHVRIDLYTLRGTLVKTLVDEETAAGTHSVFWNGRDRSDQIVASGIYLLRYEDPRQKTTKKIAVVK